MLKRRHVIMECAGTVHGYHDRRTAITAVSELLHNNENIAGLGMTRSGIFFIIAQYCNRKNKKKIDNAIVIATAANDIAAIKIIAIALLFLLLYRPGLKLGKTFSSDNY